MLKQLFGSGQASVQKYRACQPEPGEGILISVKDLAKLNLTCFSVRDCI